MLLVDFYKVQELTKKSDNEYEAHIKLNKDHAIFKGHFPGKPITPGVCMVQILKELTAEITGEKLFMKTSNNIKFMSLINPTLSENLRLELIISTDDEGLITMKNVSYFQEEVALKMSAKYQVVGK